MIMVIMMVTMVMFVDNRTYLTCKNRIIKHNTRRLVLGREATMPLDIVSSSQFSTHLSVRYVKEIRSEIRSIRDDPYWTSRKNSL